MKRYSSSWTNVRVNLSGMKMTSKQGWAIASLIKLFTAELQNRGVDMSMNTAYSEEIRETSFKQLQK